MKIETVLCAMGDALINWVDDGSNRRLRQYRYFRDWIIRHDERQRMEINQLKAQIELYKEWQEEEYD